MDVNPAWVQNPPGNPDAIIVQSWQQYVYNPLCQLAVTYGGYFFLAAFVISYIVYELVQYSLCLPNKWRDMKRRARTPEEEAAWAEERNRARLQQQDLHREEQTKAKIKENQKTIEKLNDKARRAGLIKDDPADDTDQDGKPHPRKSTMKLTKNKPAGFGGSGGGYSPLDGGGGAGGGFRSTRNENRGGG